VSDRDGGTWTSWHRCNHNGTVTEIINGVEMRFCKQHSAAEQKRRDDARRAKWDAGNRLQGLRNDVTLKRDRIVAAVLDPNTDPAKIAFAKREYQEAVARLDAEMKVPK
jgi:hypothetical protein